MRVLYVEDDAMNRTVVRDMLTVVGATMAEAPDAEQGLAMINTDEHDVVLMDLRMPGMDGLTAIRHIRARADEKALIPIVVVTADTAADLRTRCVDAGADDVLMKPVAMGALLSSLGRMLARAGENVVLP